MKAIVFAAASFAVACADKPDYDALWSKFKRQYGKSYLTSARGNDEDKRFQVFKANVDIVAQTNAKQLSYMLGINEFADLTHEEFAKARLGTRPRSRSVDAATVPFPNISSTPTSIDWVAKGAVTLVKDQGNCGSCWAFSTTGAIEGAFFVASGKLVSLSEQDLASCDFRDEGCDGGWMDHAFEWVQNNGLCAEADYAYTAGGGNVTACAETCKKQVFIAGFTDVPSLDTDAMKAAVSQQPVSVGIEADMDAFRLYTSGVLDDVGCGTIVDHGVLVVGYGTDGGKDYWKVKNSWGPSWGENGYVRIARGKNMCAIEQNASYPVVPPPSDCHDDYAYKSMCDNRKVFNPDEDCNYGGSSFCMKTCGCCGSNPKSWCENPTSKTTVV